MGEDKLTGRMLRAAIIAGANALNEKKTLIDAMNVFPVPDGDTGTNMYLTALSAAVEVERLPRESDVYAVAKAASGGALRGARGNSGVILSQLFRGFAKGLEGCTEARGEDMAAGLDQAVETAYKAIMKPKEGTILTVAREVADKAAELAGEAEDQKTMFKQILDYGNEVLLKTKDMLPALKAANVEDAGGKGFLVILEGAYASLNSRRGANLSLDLTLSPLRGEPGTEQLNNFNALGAVGTDDILFGYCTEFFIRTETNAENIVGGLSEYLDSIGDSVVVVSDEQLIKVHVHTNNPGTVLEKALSIGSIDGIKIENMRIQHTEKLSWQNERASEAEPPPTAQEAKETGFIAVSSGEGFREIFKSLGADYIIEGGQTMNPSAEAFLNAIETVNAREVIILPNNKNIILAAVQAASMSAGKAAFVVPTLSMPQGLAALVGYTHSLGGKENAEQMEETVKRVHTGSVTYAVRNTVLGDIGIAEGDAIGIINGDVVLTGGSASEAARMLSDKLIGSNISFVTVYYGEGVDPEEAEKLLEYISGQHPDCECESQMGGQPVYSYIISAE